MRLGFGVKGFRRASGLGCGIYCLGCRVVARTSNSQVGIPIYRDWNLWEQLLPSGCLGFEVGVKGLRARGCKDNVQTLNP